MIARHRHNDLLRLLFFTTFCCIGCNKEHGDVSPAKKVPPKGASAIAKDNNSQADVAAGKKDDTEDSGPSQIDAALRRIGTVGFHPDAFNHIDSLIRSSTNVPRKQLWNLALRHLKGPLLDKAANCIIKFAGREMAVDALSLASTMKEVHPAVIGAAIRDLYAKSLTDSASAEEQSAFIKSLKDQYRIPDEIVRASFVDFSSAASVDWERQRKVVDSVLHEPWIDEQTVRQAMDNLSLKQEEQTMQWISGLEDVTIFRSSITEIMGDWALRDPDAAAKWLDAQKGSSLYDWATAGLVQVFKSIDPDGANVWLGTISNPDAVVVANSGVRRRIDPVGGNLK